MGIEVWNPEKSVYWLFGNSMLGLGYSGTLLALLLSWHRLAIFLSKPIMRFISNISYSLYLWSLVMYQQFIVPFSEKIGSGVWTFLISGILTIVVTFPTAFIYYSLVEKPFSKIHPKLS
jgi:peptidoglycan/LPS O-acetylase OafA/YrhL